MQLCNDQNNCITDSVIANPKRTESTQGKNPTQSKYAQKTISHAQSCNMHTKFANGACKPNQTWPSELDCNYEFSTARQ